MTENRIENKNDQGKETSGITRRKAVKKIAGGITALVAYQTLPAKWETPVIESIFLPAHAQTSGNNGIAPVDPSVPVTPGHPDHPDYPIAPSHPDHPHNNPMAVIGSFSTIEIVTDSQNPQGPTSAIIEVDITINRIAQYTWTLVNLENNSSDSHDFIAQTIPVTVPYPFLIEGKVGDKVELTVTNNLTSEVDKAQYVIEAVPATVSVDTPTGCGSTITTRGVTPYQVTITTTISPNPGIGKQVTFQNYFNGSPDGITYTLPTDASGRVAQTYTVAVIPGTIGLTATYQGTTSKLCEVSLQP